MTPSPHELAILALFMTSVIVRILPVFMPIRLNNGARRILERELPFAVFINFFIYIAWIEIRISPTAAAAAIVMTAVITLTTRMGLILTTAASTAVYIAVQLSIRA